MATTSSSSQPATLRSAQLQSLVSLLNFNTSASSSKSAVHDGGSSSGSQHQPQSGTGAFDVAAGPLTWKVLVLDKVSQEVLATSMRVQDLRDQGVTLHM